jgi:DNA-binding TFAR19-related protein (PDSD5 family)
MNDEKEKDDQHELNKIRMKKLQAMMDAQKQKEETQKQSSSLQDKIDFVLRVVLAPDAYEYLKKLEESDPNVYQRIYNELISQDVVQNIDYLVYMIQRRGGVPRKIPKDVIVYLERQIKGIKSRIKVKRGDDIMDLGSYLTKDKD